MTTLNLALFECLKSLLMFTLSIAYTRHLTKQGSRSACPMKASYTLEKRKYFNGGRLHMGDDVINSFVGTGNPTKEVITNQIVMDQLYAFITKALSRRSKRILKRAANILKRHDMHDSYFVHQLGRVDLMKLVDISASITEV